MPLDPDREIYPNAPLRLVAFEVRYPPVPQFESATGQERIYEALRDDFPIYGPPPITQFELGAGGTRQSQRGVTFMNRQRTLSVAITNESLAIETSAYERFEHFSALIQRVVRVAEELGRIPAMLRLGLRYIDEIVVPGVEGVEAWREYIADDLIAAGQFHGYPTLDYRVSLAIRIGDDHVVNVRGGMVRDRILNPDGALRIAQAPQGEYFLLDLDSYWSSPGDEYPEFSSQAVLETCERLHDPIRTVFERAIKPKLRDEVLRHERPTEDHHG